MILRLLTCVIITSYTAAVAQTEITSVRLAFPYIDFCSWPNPFPLATVAPEFEVFTRYNSTQFTIANESQVNSSVEALDRFGYTRSGWPVVFLVHGFRDTHKNSYVHRMKEALLTLADHTVIAVGWENGAYLNPFKYTQAASNTQTTAEAITMVARSISKLNTFAGNRSSLYLYCTGHSLGAHVCGQAGLKAHGLFDRVTGLDPAGPGFEDCPNNPSIAPESAECVDVIHSDGNSSGHIDPIIRHLGSMKKMGFVDFYPNGGAKQPGCTIFGNDYYGCSHMRSEDLFIFTIKMTPGRCLAQGPCGNANLLPDKSCYAGRKKQLMGFYSDCHQSVAPSERKGGVFYLSTASDTPYC